MSETALTKIEEHAIDRATPRDVIRQATEEANELANVIESRSLWVAIQGRKYVKCEGWTTLAALRGCLPREVTVDEFPDGRYVALVELVRMSDQAVLTRASAECGGPDDGTWQNRPPYARRSMAITRATGKACRIAFSWVMALAGYEVTPAEEMDGIRENSADRVINMPKRASEGKKTPSTPASEAIQAYSEAKASFDGFPNITTVIKDVKAKEGQTKGKLWTLWTIIDSDEQKYGTFDQAIAEQAKFALDSQVPVLLYYEHTDRGRKAVRIEASKEEVPL
jgi:hypothetical protein